MPGVFKNGFMRDAGGNVATISALCAVPLLFAAFGVVDLMGASNEHATLQAAVDAGALAGAGRLSVAQAMGNTNVTETAIRIAQQTLDAAHITDHVTFTVAIASDGNSVTVEGRTAHKPMIGFLHDGDETLSVSATAENLGSVPLCVLQTGTTGGITLDNSARIRATGCAIHANQNITVKSSAMIQADRTQATGKVSGPISPAGNSGAMAIPDPFASMNLKPPTACVGKPEEIKEKTGVVFTLAPGVHCEHFKIEKNATLILQPGEHYFMDDLEAHENAIIQGDDVVLIFGSTKKINFADKASVRLGARKSGTFAGFLIVTTRDNHEIFSISSDHVSKLLGTIYIPSAQLAVSTVGSVGQDSAWSIIVADSLRLTHNPNLVINNNYSGTSVPVPDGVGPNRNAPVLSR